MSLVDNQLFSARSPPPFMRLQSGCTRSSTAELPCTCGTSGTAFCPDHSRYCPQYFPHDDDNHLRFGNNLQTNPTPAAAFVLPDPNTDERSNRSTAVTTTVDEVIWTPVFATARPASEEAMQMTDIYNSPSYPGDTDVPETLMRSSGLIGQHERTEDQPPPFMISGMGPVYIVNNGQEDTSPGARRVCGVFYDQRLAQACGMVHGSEITEHSTTAEAWLVWVLLHQNGRIKLPTHPASIWRVIVTWGTFTDRWRTRFTTTRDQRLSPSPLVAPMPLAPPTAAWMNARDPSSLPIPPALPSTPLLSPSLRADFGVRALAANTSNVSPDTTLSTRIDGKLYIVIRGREPVTVCFE